MADSKSKAKDERTADEIRRDIAATRACLAAGVENLVEEVHPATLKREASDRARDFVQGEFDQVKSQVKDENGWRVQRIAMAAGVLAAGVVSIIVLRAIAALPLVANLRSCSFLRRSGFVKMPSSVVRKTLKLPRKMPSSARRTLRSTASSIPMTRR